MPRYAGPIVDAHHHFWEPSLGRNPWLLPGVDIGFRYGPYESIKRDYLPPDMARDTEGLRVVSTVTMETEWDLDDPVGEMDHIRSVQERFGLPDAAVGHAVLDDPGVEAVLAAFTERRIVRAVRNKPGQAASASVASAHRTKLDDPAWQRGYAMLERYGLDFELQTAWWHLDRAEALAERHPGLPVTINHTALPSDRSEEGLSGWEAAIRSIARLEHVHLKVSGIGLQGVPWTAGNNRRIVETAIEVFGVERVMFASNFPVDGLAGGYAEIMGGFLEITEGFAEHEQHAMFAGNAVTRYRLDPGVLERPSLAERWPA
ncbi:amidohydrolase family protein [Arenivirga flava]|uniref:Amidohydrolase-related domain-containing protein n=1 Tax=Arenivirga flava TaxID=1930060 RepID=A0AA37XC17_9MICO|nr:amidohydrolase family protein [Arenivirga flava]GMA29115.1 hypothetical protein GCM10025874_23680 [Arenivirga flava]